jgi:hypothetical protein
MTAADLRRLARWLGALLPQRTLGALAHAPQEVDALAERLTTACLTAGVVEQDAARIADSLSGYLCGWGRHSDQAEAWRAQGTALLTFARGGHGDDVVLLVPYGVMLTDKAIAQLLYWTLLEDREEEA